MAGFMDAIKRIAGSRGAEPERATATRWAGYDPNKLRLYLDIDGVLHPRTNGSLSCLVHVERAVELLACPVDVVISSSWRVEHTLEWFAKQFAAHGAHRLAAGLSGATPDLDHRGQTQWIRQAEIEAYERDRPSNHLILDNSPGLFEPGLKRLYICDLETGFTEAEIPALVTLGRRFLRRAGA